MISYLTLGSETDTPLVFIHGLGAGAKQTTSALTDLPGRRIIAPNMPGHGDDPDHDPELFSFDFFADQVIEVMDHLGIDQTDLGGLSMGSGISLNIALRYPGRVKKLILLRPSWLDSPRPAHLELVARVNAGMGADDPDFQALAESNPPVAASISPLFGSPHTAVLDKMWNDCPFHSLDDLKKITVPALVLSSPRDDLHPKSVADAIAAALPNVVDNASLPARYHEPESYQIELNKHINQFLNS